MPFNKIAVLSNDSILMFSYFANIYRHKMGIGICYDQLKTFSCFLIGN
jgi:hypothetical protein